MWWQLFDFTCKAKLVIKSNVPGNLLKLLHNINANYWKDFYLQNFRKRTAWSSRIFVDNLWLFDDTSKILLSGNALMFCSRQIRTPESFFTLFILNVCYISCIHSYNLRIWIYEVYRKKSYIFACCFTWCKFFSLIRKVNIH